MAGMVHIAKERVPIAQLQLTEDEVQRETGEGHHQSLFETSRPGCPPATLSGFSLRRMQTAKLFT